MWIWPPPSTACESAGGAVLDWEAGRARRVVRFLDGSAADLTGTTDDLGKRLLARKLDLGPDELERRVGGRVRAADVGTTAAARLARGARVSSRIDILSPHGSARDFVDWFQAQSQLPHSEAMLAACPDHYVIAGKPDGRQMVIETTGGSPLPTRFFIDYGDTSSLSISPTDGFPLQIAGVARASGGRAVGGVRHQFRDVESGFEARLAVDFPRGVPNRMVAAHRWHLACEFGNWIEFQWAFRSTPGGWRKP